MRAPHSHGVGDFGQLIGVNHEVKRPSAVHTQLEEHVVAAKAALWQAQPAAQCGRGGSCA